MSEHENNTSTDKLQPAASPDIVSLTHSDSDISNFEEGVNIASTQKLNLPYLH
jgi:hypothetical protein